MGIRFYCPNGHKLNVKEFQAGRRGICPYCGAKFQIPTQSTRPASKGKEHASEHSPAESSEDSGTNLMVSQIEEAAHAEETVALPPVEPAVAAGAHAPVEPLEIHAVAAAPLAVATPPQYPTVAAPQYQAQPLAPQGASLPVAIPPSTPPAATTPATPDPLNEAPQMIWYVRPPSGGQFGPAPGDLMRTWLAEGRVSADSLVWREGWRDWQEAGTIFPQLRGNDPLSFVESAAAGAVAASSEVAVKHDSPRHRSARSKNQQLTIVLLLSMAVVLLMGIFLWVLFYFH
ncbi:MAG: DUF4339 domain-containing protein [Thermoguttaceae bacterium]|jgi:hypothetical protein